MLFSYLMEENTPWKGNDSGAATWVLFIYLFLLIYFWQNILLRCLLGTIFNSFNGQAGKIKPRDNIAAPTAKDKTLKSSEKCDAVSVQAPAWEKERERVKRGATLLYSLH